MKEEIKKILKELIRTGELVIRVSIEDGEVYTQIIIDDEVIYKDEN